MRSLLCLLFLLLGGRVDSLRVLRNTIDISESDPLGGAKLTSVVEPVYTEDLTICIRFNLKVLGSWENKAKLIQIEDWRNDTVDPKFRFLWFGAWYPETFFGFGSPIEHGSFSSYLLKDPILNTYKIWNPNKWSHVCLSYEKRRSYIRMVKDGQTLNVNFPDPALSKVIIPPDFLTKTYVGRCATDVQRGCSAPGALFTDFNVWDRALEEKEMQEWTDCNDMAKGNIVDWETSGWELENMVEEELLQDAKSLCKPARMGYVFFPEQRNFSANLDICHKLKGKMPVVTSEKVLDHLIKLLDDYFTVKDLDNQFWGGWTDEEDNGIFRNINTGEDLQEEAYHPWFPGEPNGDLIENCVQVWPTRRAWNDNDCKTKIWSFCEFETSPYLQMKGLCFGSLFDHKYSWTGHLIEGHHSFQGYKDTVLFLDPETKLWRLESYTYPYVYATVESEEYPLGTYTWTVYNDTCNDGKNESLVTLNFNACTNEEFNCKDGNCVPIAGRCDGRIDCADKTDEIDCRMIEIDQSYIKEIPAPPIESSLGGLTGITVNVDVLSVLEINEVEGIFAVQFMLSLTWVDTRLVLNNLKEEEYFNTVSVKDKDKIWLPQVVFFNTEKKEGSLQDEQAFVTISRKGTYQISPLSSLENVHVYSGKYNPLTIQRVYSTKFICKYDMGRYPFDKQQCSIKITLKGNTGSYAKLLHGQLNYLGDIDLTQYYVKEWKIYENKVTGNQTSVEVKMVLGRRSLNEFLTTYFPTILICIVSFSTNYFQAFYFEAIVTVNLTSLLVLTTLFISVSNSLPNTSYVKMIDVWLIFVLCVPFMEVLLHTMVDAYRKDDDMELNHTRINVTGPAGKVAPLANSTAKPGPASRDRFFGPNSRSYKRFLKDELNMYICQGVLRMGLPILFVAFSVVYFGLGVTYSNT